MTDIKVGDLVRYSRRPAFEIVGLVLEKNHVKPQAGYQSLTYLYTLEILERSGQMTSLDIFDIDEDSGRLEVLQSS